MFHCKTKASLIAIILGHDQALRERFFCLRIRNSFSFYSDLIEWERISLEKRFYNSFKVEFEIRGNTFHELTIKWVFFSFEWQEELKSKPLSLDFPVKSICWPVRWSLWSIFWRTLPLPTRTQLTLERPCFSRVHVTWNPLCLLVNLSLGRSVSQTHTSVWFFAITDPAKVLDYSIFFSLPGPALGCFVFRLIFQQFREVWQSGPKDQMT